MTTLLPKDVSSDGFDNIAAVLRISPTFLDQYISAARNVSRQAIGRAGAKPSTRELRVHGADQSGHIDGLPLGTRGGMLVEHYFPADGEYEFNIRDFFFGGAGYVTRVDQAHKVILTIDDVRVFEQAVGGQEDLDAVDVRQAAAAEELQARFNHIRVKMKAGPHRVGIAFIQRSFAQSDSPLQPIAALPEMERYPTIPGVDISGPFNVTGVSETEQSPARLHLSARVGGGRAAVRAAHSRRGWRAKRFDGRPRKPISRRRLRSMPRAAKRATSKPASRTASPPFCRARNSCSARSRRRAMRPPAPSAR